MTAFEPALGLRLSRAWGGGRGAAIFYLALGLAACELALHARGAYRIYHGQLITVSVAHVPKTLGRVLDLVEHSQFGPPPNGVWVTHVGVS